MSEPRLATFVLVDALRRLAEAAGAQATVVARGEATSGAVVLLIRDRDGNERAFERSPAGMGPVSWNTVGPALAADMGDYLARRRRSDPDLWAIEISGHPDPLSIVAGMTG